MKKQLKELTYGFLFGISCIIPGFSGGTMLVILGIYEEITSKLSNAFKKPLKTVTALLFYGIGIILGTIIGTLIVANLLKKIPLLIASFFIGLVIATIIIIIKSLNTHKAKLKDYLISIVFMIISISLTLMGKKVYINTSFNKFSFFKVIYILLLTMLASATMIIPAVSGMTILLIFGLYDPLMHILNDILIGLLMHNLNPLVNNLWFLIPTFLGIILGITIASKMINKMLKNNIYTFWYAVLGLLIISPITILQNISQNYLIDFSKLSPLMLLNSFIFLGIGIFILLFIDHKTKKNKV